MSPSTRSWRSDARGWVAAALLALGTVAGAVPAANAAPALAAAAATLVPNAEARGGGSLTFFGLHIYDGYYYAPPGTASGWHPEDPFALQFIYRRALNGAKIAQRSSEEIANLGYGTAEQRLRWGASMKAIFPNVAAGDHLTGVNLSRVGVRYFHNGRPIGAIDDPEFAKAFFAMWLDPRTSEPGLRKELLGEHR